MNIFSRAIRDLRGQKAFVVLFCVNVSLGLVGLGIIETWRKSFDETLTLKSQSMLGADVTVSSRKNFEPEEISYIEKIAREEGALLAKSQNLYTMAVANSKSRLIELRANAEVLPFYGTIQLEETNPLKGARKLGSKEIWVYPEIALQLGIQVNSQVKIGEAEFTLKGIISDDPAGGWAGSAIAPRAYILNSDLLDTKLVKKGSTISTSYLFKSKNEAQSSQIVTKLQSHLNDPGINISNHRESGQQSAKLFKYVSDYLSLVSLTALMLTGIAASWLYRQFFKRRMSSTAIYVALGATKNQAFSIGVVQVVILAFISAIVATLISFATSAGLIKLVHEFLPWAITPKFEISSFIRLAFIAVSTCLVVCLPWLIELRNLSPIVLLNDAKSVALDNHKYQTYSLVVQVLFFLGLAMWEAKSIYMGLIFSGGLIAAILFLLLTSKLSSHLIKLILPLLQAPFRHGLLRVIRQDKDTAPVIIALGIATLLTVLLPTIKNLLKEELDVKSAKGVPSIFLVDIQDEQRDPLESYLRSINSNIQLISPMIQSRLLSKNGQPITRLEGKEYDTREVERSRQSHNRGYNLSYRDQLDQSEKLTLGVWPTRRFDPQLDEMAQISLEENFAGRVGMKLGDVLVFEIEGVEVTGKVTSFRSVKWGSFQPNFFILFQPGALEDAPKTWVASLGLNKDIDKIALQNSIIEKFSNISVLDVERIFARILDIVDKTSIILGILAALSVLSGFLVLATITKQMLLEREKDLLLFKVAGADQVFISKILLSEIALTASVASSMGLFLGLGVAKLIGWLLFKSNAPIFLGYLYFIPLLFTLLSLIFSLGTIRRISLKKTDISILSRT